MKRLLVFLVVLGCGLLMTMTTQSASAHVGGRAQILVRELRFAPGADSWQVRLTAVDLDSGAPVPGVEFRLRLESPAATAPVMVTLAPGGTVGTYAGTFAAAPGTWQLTIVARSRPGFAAVYPYERRFGVTLAADRETDLGKTEPAPADNAWWEGGITSAGVGAGLVAAALGVRRHRRRSRAVDAAAPGLSA